MLFKLVEELRDEDPHDLLRPGSVTELHEGARLQYTVRARWIVQGGSMTIMEA